ncbi:hypothetical protein [Janibacter sp. G1551]|jgi:hypothetical protein|uniref:hypothetical protein n=1 Tax=Janibacter sp. G1551 TaxID=3420440 RepID=UPI003CFF2530
MSTRTNARPPMGDTRSTLMRVGVLVTIAALVATAVWLGARGRNNADTDPDKNAGDSSSQSDGAARTAEVEQVAPAAAPEDGVVIPTGADQHDGYPTGFPQTDLGAVALQVELAKAQVGFDYDQAVTVAGLYADTDDKTAFEKRARDAVALRRQQAGVAAEGEAPAPASYAVTPIAYTLEELDTGYYAVNLLSYVTLTNTDGDVEDSLYAGTQLIRWVEVDSAGNKVGDWRLVEGSSEDLERLVAEGQPKAVAPGTPEFEQAGWVPISGAPL